jgi:hypothetical protein
LSPDDLADTLGYTPDGEETEPDDIFYDRFNMQDTLRAGGFENMGKSLKSFKKNNHLKYRKNRLKRSSYTIFK